MKNFLINFGAIALVLTILVLMFRKELKELLPKKKADELEGESDEHEIKENEFLYWFLNILGAGLVWLIIILLWIALPVNIEGFNLWLIAFCVWPVIAFKMSAHTLEPNEIGGIYGLPMFGGGIPLRNNLKPEKMYFAFPMFVSLETDSASNRVYEIKGITDEELKKEVQKQGLSWEQSSIEALISSWGEKGMYRFREITTATPKLAESHWNTFPFPENASADEKNAIKKNITEDVNSKQITLTPSLQVIIMIKDYFLYRKNVEGKNPEERRLEAGQQLTNIARSMVNTEFKKRTYSQLIWMQTGKELDNALEREVDKLLKGYEEGASASLGLKAIDTRVTALGAPAKVHDELNEVVKEGFSVEKKALEGEGDKQKMIKVAEGTKEKLHKEGEGAALALKALLTEATASGINPAKLAELQAQIKMFESGKVVYFTGGNSSSSMSNDEAYAKFAELITNLLKEKGVVK
ncbi:MAG: hypothetical protein QG644_125 [Patescibacteria group bacterium]|nr:hypothetical protein [Patescibacteria group bacterium]